MRRWPIILATIVLLLLTVAALDDLTTGEQPHFYLEYAMVAITALWCGALVTLRLRRGA